MNRVSMIIATTLLATAGASAQQGNVLRDSDLAEEQEELRRYAVEIILFTYDRSVSAGTEIFEPDPPLDEETGALVADPLVDEGESYVGPGSLADPAALDSALSTDAVNADVPEYGDTLPMPDDVVPDDIADIPLVDLVSTDGIELERIPQDQLTLVAAHEKLIQVDAYQPVLWAGWTQVALAEEATPSLRLRRLGPVPLDISGTLKLYLSRFLHLVVDIELEERTEAVVLADESERYGTRFERRSRDRYDLGFGYREVPPPVTRYRISEDRIIANGELRYFDHPRFGLLAKLTRIEEEDEIEETDPESAIEAEPSDTTDDLLPR